MGNDLLEIDKKIFLFLNGKHNDYLDVLMHYISSLLLWIPLSFIIGYILIKNINAGNKHRITLSIFLIVLLAFFQFIICVEFLPTIFHNLIHRQRPCYNPDLSGLIHIVDEDFGGNFDFFGPRSCLAFSVAAFLFFSFRGEHYKWLKGLFFAWAILIAYSRIYVGAHYPVSVLISACVGGLTGYLIYRSFFYIKDSVLAL